MSLFDGAAPAALAGARPPVAGALRRRAGEWWAQWRPSVLLAATAAVALALACEVAALLFAGGPGALLGVFRHPETALSVWNHYDAGWYLGIAADGYPAHAHDPSQAGSFGDATAFPPLFPLAIRGVATLLHIPLLAAALLISGLTLVPALAAFHRLAVDRVGAQRGRIALLLIATTPAAFFLVAPYGLSLLLLLVCGALLASRAQRWALAGTLGGLCLLTKLYAGAVVAAMLVEYMEARRWKLSAVRADVAWTFAPAVAALGAWCAYLWATFGGPLRFVHAEAAWGRHLVAPWTTFAHGVNQIVQEWGSNADALVHLLETVSIALLIGLTVYAARRMRRSDAVFIGLSGAAIATNELVASAHRYLLVVAPVYVALAMLLGRRGRLAVVAVSLVLGAFLLQRFVTGAWAG